MIIICLQRYIKIHNNANDSVIVNMFLTIFIGSLYFVRLFKDGFIIASLRLKMLN